MLETRRDPPVRLKLGNVHVLGDPVAVAANGLAVSHPGRLRGQPAILGDQAMTAEDEVGRRFRRPRTRVSIGRDAPARLPGHQLGPILALADRFIAGRQVEQNRRAGTRLHRTGRKRHPEVLADLNTHHDRNALVALACEQQVDTEGNSAARELDLGRLGTVGGAEPPALVKLLVIGDVPLGNDPQDVAVRDHHGAVEKAIAHRHGKPDDDKLPSALRRPGNPADALEATLQQGSLAKQIGTCVARDAKLGKDHDVAIGHLVQNAHKLIGVGHRVGHRGPDRYTAHADETKAIHATNPRRSRPMFKPGNLRPAPTTGIIRRKPQDRPIDRLSPPRVKHKTPGINGLELGPRISHRVVLNAMRSPIESLKFLVHS